MDLGEKLRHARLQAGMSQRQLAGEEITRNMLSQIEHGSAMPSMRTLQYLSDRLGKPVSYFLDEGESTSPNQSLMDSARRLYDRGEYAQAVLVLEGYQSPDPVFDRERELLWTLLHLGLADHAIREGREPYALTLLAKAAKKPTYCGDALERQRLLLLGRCRGQQVSRFLPSLDEELLLRAQEALATGNHKRAAQLLEAAESQTAPRWQLLRGKVHYAQQEFQEAAACFHGAEGAFPRETAALLEGCYRELGDYRQAYAYACKQR